MNKRAELAAKVAFKSKGSQSTRDIFARDFEESQKLARRAIQDVESDKIKDEECAPA